MRHGTTNRRQRNRNNSGSSRRGGNQRMQVFDSNGPDVRIRGTAHQVAEKYMALAKDATSTGDIVLAQSYLQHAEHYQRVINSWAVENEKAPQEQKKTAPEGNTKDSAKENGDIDDLSLPASILGEEANTSDGKAVAEASA